LKEELGNFTALVHGSAVFDKDTQLFDSAIDLDSLTSLESMSDDSFLAKVAECMGLSVMKPIRGVLLFADNTRPLLPILKIHTIRKHDGSETFKATCCEREHGKCVLWITQIPTTVHARRKILLQYLRWAAGGRDQNETQHFDSAQRAKVIFGMRK
jgi:hypothetical protein